MEVNYRILSRVTVEAYFRPKCVVINPGEVCLKAGTEFYIVNQDGTIKRTDVNGNNPEKHNTPSVMKNEMYYYTYTSCEGGIPCKIVRANKSMEIEQQVFFNEFLEDACFLESGYILYVAREKDDWGGDRHLVCLNADLKTVWETTIQENKEHYSFRNAIFDAVLLVAVRPGCLRDVILKVSIDGSMAVFEDNLVGITTNTASLQSLFSVNLEGRDVVVNYIEDYEFINEIYRGFNKRIVITKYDESGSIKFFETYPAEIRSDRPCLSYSEIFEKVLFTNMKHDTGYALEEIDLSTKQRKELISDNTIYGDAKKEGILYNMRFSYDLPPLLLDNGIAITAWGSYSRIDEKAKSRICLSYENRVLLLFDVDGALEEAVYKDGILYLITAFSGRRTGLSFVYFIELEM